MPLCFPCSRMDIRVPFRGVSVKSFERMSSGSHQSVLWLAGCLGERNFAGGHPALAVVVVDLVPQRLRPILDHAAGRDKDGPGGGVADDVIAAACGLAVDLRPLAVVGVQRGRDALPDRRRAARNRRKKG